MAGIGGAFITGARISAAKAGAAIATTVATLNRIRFMGIPRFRSTLLIPQARPWRCYRSDTGDNYRRVWEDWWTAGILGISIITTIIYGERQILSRLPS